MPVYLHHQNIIVRKEALEKHYEGGLNNFIKKYEVKQSKNFNEHDQELVSISGMSEDFVPILNDFELMGLHYDEKKDMSKDYVVHLRGEGLSWEAPWLKYNAVYAWHSSRDEKEFERVFSMSAKEFETFVEEECSNGSWAIW